MQRITVVVQNRPGLLAEITELLAAKRLSISSIVADSVGAQGVLHLGVEHVDEALAALAAAGYDAACEDVLLARIEDRPGALAQLSRRLMEAQLDIRGLNMVRRDEGWAVVAIATSDNARARDVLAGQTL
ncbi:MAG TPA: ACT domain-containing protein [Candidatus Baltobacteraceae bacterium]|nr:ACT domain-containing protein [Candidatus Baltobacteraceae bacterium]